MQQQTTAKATLTRTHGTQDTPTHTLRHTHKVKAAPINVAIVCVAVVVVMPQLNSANYLG